MKACRLLLPLIWLWVVSACTPTPAIDQQSGLAKVLVINSNQSIPRYQTAETGFKSTLRRTRMVSVDLGDDQQPTETLQDLLNQEPYAVIYCIGAKALGSIEYLAPDTPVVYSSVLSWRRFQHQPGYFGISSEVAPAAQLAWFKYFFPAIQRIGVMYSDTNSALLEDARHAAEALSLTLVTTRVHDPADIPPQQAGLMQQADALWVLPDPVVLNSEADTYRLFAQAEQLGKPVFAYNSFFMGLGATLSINPDLLTSGRQAALIARRLLQRTPPESKVQFPAGSSISLNLRKVNQYQLQLNRDALQQVNELLE
ncbi:MAG: ABC transporter substrate binding protein [Pseudomonadota bacterium]|nr:ABC transporter substrate binding protein [Pseudomonadota bacterium]